MKAFLVLLAALTIFGSQAHAADIRAAQPVYKAPEAATPVSNWGGFYAGFHGGYGWGNASIDPLISITGVTTTQPFANPNPSGFVFGGQAGYNWEVGSYLVTGLELDYSAADMTSSETIPVGRLTTATLATKIDSMASGRARVGFAILPSVLLYGTGGVAWGHTSATETLARTAPVAAISQTVFADQFGWVLGAGVETKLVDHFLVRAEYLHYDFGDATYAFTPISGSAKVTADVIRGGIGYKF
jgi:outer membrane immunogenic protein